jgi:hypothetical protein
LLGLSTYRSLLDAGEYVEIDARAVRIESRTNLLFSFEKMAIRDAVKSQEGARAFAEGLFRNSCTGRVISSANSSDGAMLSQAYPASTRAS